MKYLDIASKKYLSAKSWFTSPSSTVQTRKNRASEATRLLNKCFLIVII